jgi:hypothetical protein
MMSVSTQTTQTTPATTPLPAEQPMPVPVPIPVLERVRRGAAKRYFLLTETVIAARGTAALRIGYGSLWVLFLLREWPERDAAWGLSSPWTPALDRQFFAAAPMFSPLRFWYLAVSGLDGVQFQLFYLAAMLVGLLFALGWHTRATSLLFAFVVVALENRVPLLTDGGDNVLLLMSLYLCAARCGTRWSLDARRARLRREQAESAASAAEPPERPEWLAELNAVREQVVNLMHNGIVLVIAVQVCVIYETAGMLKVQGPLWQQGTALSYVLQLNWFEPWPALNHWVIQQQMGLAIFGYVTVFVQVGFPFAVFSPRLKYPSLILLTMMHAGIAVLMGLPLFSLIMLTGDLIFFSDRMWAAVERWVAGPAYPPA